ncbi:MULTISPECIES: dolichol kinase [Halobacterium]|uniref:Dolichol kinase n=4 Tax=Halobacterium salinarum TaxID=2242 RepID=A0A510NA86_HALSA|nr:MULTISPECIES: dolichol kinase [Halobacterium]MBB6089614.1 dolichol kinase [Halobacterium salinarum]MCF2164362.1 dolichol kinase [Halobacterium salinarum]MCF2167149.1 dolichol kinase [Halobacterium salinarum]MCF2238614.1 dolichol kinase [Halobacterium salinarum]MDL0120980.1 dolichol kinase [Halobacterium salinarum]
MSELRRRLVHASGAVIPAGFLGGVVSWRVVQGLFVVGAAIAVVLELLRLSGRVSWRVYDALTREYEQDNPAGYALYMLAGAATVVVFPASVAVPAVLMLSIGDPVSGLLSGSGTGLKQGWVLLATFGVCLGIASLLAVPLSAGVAGAVTATLADGTTPVVRGYVIDDNASIPLGSAAAMWLVAAV